MPVPARFSMGRKTKIIARAASPTARQTYSRRQLLANAAIEASRVGSNFGARPRRNGGILRYFGGGSGAFLQTTTPLTTSPHRSSPPSLRVGEMSDGCAILGGALAGAGAIIASNRLASTIKFASVLTTDSRNGANRRVPAIGASAISISRPSERYLTSGTFARWPAIG